MGKSAIKDAVFRAAPAFTTSITYVPVKECASRWDAMLDDPRITVVAEDAPVRYAPGPTRPGYTTGLSFALSFLAPVHTVFRVYPHVTTYILCFDKRRYVPTQKGRCQEKRVRAYTKSAPVPVQTRADILEHETIPPWTDVRSTRDRQFTALDALVDLIIKYAQIPPGRTLIIDHARTDDRDVDVAPYICHCTMTGTRVPTYRDITKSNRCGEADLALQWWTWHATDPISNILPTGGMCMRTVDTDYLPYSIMHAAAHQNRTEPVYLTLSKTWRNAGNTGYATKHDHGAIQCHEIYDIGALTRAVRLGYEPGTHPVVAAASFATMCFSGENDFCDKPVNTSHARLWSAYLGLRGTPLVTWTVDGIAINAQVFTRYIDLAYSGRGPKISRISQSNLIDLITIASWNLGYVFDAVPGALAASAPWARVSAPPDPDLDSLSDSVSSYNPPTLLVFPCAHLVHACQLYTQCPECGSWVTSSSVLFVGV